MSRPSSRLPAAVLVLAAMLAAGADEPPLSQELRQVEALRDDGGGGGGDLARRVESRGEVLLSRYTLPDDRARIRFQLAHVLAQADIRRHARLVASYARLALEAERDPDRRGVLHSYLGSALLVDPAEPDFTRQRRRAAAAWLEGYAELLPLDLPAEAPELPIVGKAGPESGDPAGQEEALRVHAAQMEARREAERIRQLVGHREIFVRQLAEVYRREPPAGDELERLASRAIRDPRAVRSLLERTRGK